MSYWQVAAGDGNREYSDIFLRYGIMLIGPGDPGNYFDNREYYETEYNYNDIKYFAEEVTHHDIIVLKRPSKLQWQVLAVGRVKGG